MKNENDPPMLKSYRDFNDAAENVLKLMSQFIHINTLFIAKNDLQTNTIVKVYNQDQVLLKEGSQLPFKETFCRLSVDQGREILVIPDITEYELTSGMKVTENLGGGSFIGIPIYYENGKNYGTICGLDNKPFEFTEKHIELFTTISSLLTFVLELEQANNQIQNLSAPIVPITKGIAILPIIGDITQERYEIITKMALMSSERMDLSYLVIDLSGILRINDRIGSFIENIVNMLQLIGTTPVLTGIRPDLAMKVTEMSVKSFNDLIIESTLERALKRIGLYFTEQEVTVIN
ncbi:GAF domain-containing protein [Jeotgalibacillus soli]|nr:GAF domain-containing protein [Jeotgalibacillus soli]